jgi:polyisoprenoid-binding protein YceI
MTRSIAAILAASVGLVLVATCPTGAAGMSWTVDSAESSIGFVGRQMGVPVEGSFEKFSAQIDFDPEKPEDGSIMVDVDMTSVQLPVADVVVEIKKEKWFDVERFPRGHFEASSIEAKGEGNFVAKGKLTLRDVTRDVEFPFSLSLADAGDKMKATANGEMSVSRIAFGIGTGEWGDTGIVADEVGIRIQVSGTRPK